MGDIVHAQAEERHLQRLPSEIHTDTSKELSISSPSKECTPDNTSTVDPRLNLPSEISSQFPPCQKEPLCPTVRVSSEIEDHSPEPLVPMPSSSATPMMERRPESDFHQEPESPLLVAAEPWSDSLPVVRELISHSLRLTELGIRLKQRGTTGQELEVLP